MDCNLMVLELHEPEYYKQMHEEYDGLVNGVQQSRKVAGVVSMRQFLRKNSNYKRIIPAYQRQGDVVVFPKGFNCYLSLGDKWFGVCHNDTFGFMPLCGHDPDSYLVFRKE
tara:strand:- start:68 stop:400 length:333 start_codon:yes stop_codon:yes gene_type:complete